MTRFLLNRRWLQLYRCYGAHLSHMSEHGFAKLCFDWDYWFINDPLEWEKHCQVHLERVDELLRCDPLIFRNALVKPGYCPSAWETQHKAPPGEWSSL